MTAPSVEHQYVVTEEIPGAPRDLPTFRDPDHLAYMKPETGGLDAPDTRHRMGIPVGRLKGPEIQPIAPYLLPGKNKGLAYES